MIDFKKLAKYSKAGPRYTSYPTANEFKKLDSENLIALLEKSNESSLPLSIYTHLPFCKSACYFCGCNVIYTSKKDKKKRYIKYLLKELELLKKYIDTKKEVVQFHFGGGTPTFFNADELDFITKSIKKVFSNFVLDSEISCEVDPRHFEEEQMKALRENGFNRISLGVQDFDDKVQRSINRIQSFELIEKNVELIRKYGINSINFDLIYGLPFQNVKSFEETLKKVMLLNPDRLAIFNYAHVPWIKKTMMKIDEKTLPTPEVKLEILKNMISILQSNGYEMIGMDHFAKKTDELYISKQNGILRRNFQGYTTRGFSQTIGIGLTSISEGANFYSQNFKDMEKYENALDNNILPVNVGIVLNDEDIIRKEIIMDLMNNSLLDMEKYFNFNNKFKNELIRLREFRDLGLLEMDNRFIKINPTGNMLIRNIAMIFDTYLKNNNQTFSKTV